MISIIVFALIFAIALAKVGEINRPVVSFFESIFAATMKVTDWIMYFAAPGFRSYCHRSFKFWGRYFQQYFEILTGLGFGFYPILRSIPDIPKKTFSKVPILMLYTAITEAMMVAFGTASSSATLPL